MQKANGDLHDAERDKQDDLEMNEDAAANWEDAYAKVMTEESRGLKMSIVMFNTNFIEKFGDNVRARHAANPTSDDWLKLKRSGRYVNKYSHIGIQSDCDSAGERKTRKSVIRF